MYEWRILVSVTVDCHGAYSQRLARAKHTNGNFTCMSSKPMSRGEKDSHPIPLFATNSFLIGLMSPLPSSAMCMCAKGKTENLDRTG